jgi:chromosome segregation ATPase
MTPPNITEAARKLLETIHEQHTVWTGTADHQTSYQTSKGRSEQLKDIELAITTATAPLEQRVKELEEDNKALRSWTGCICIHHNDKDREAVGCFICLKKERDQLQQSNTKLTERVKEADSRAVTWELECNAMKRDRDTLTQKLAMVEKVIDWLEKSSSIVIEHSGMKFINPVNLRELHSAALNPQRNHNE